MSLRPPLGLALVALALLTAVGCEHDGGSAPPEPVLVQVAGGDGQTGVVGGMTGEPLVVRVQTAGGTPVAHASVSWSASGGGLVMPGVTTTDANGLAVAYWLLDARVGVQTATATVERATEEAHFSAVAELVAEPVIEGARRLALATYEGSGQVVHPDVVSTPRGWGTRRRHLAITPYPYGRADRENPSVFEGDDGEGWEIPSGATNPVALPAVGSYLSDPDQLWVPETRELWMYYRQVTTTDNVIFLTRSGDGVRWSPAIEVTRAPNHLIVSPSVVRRGPRDWLMWSVNSGSVGCRAARTTVELRRSEDGVAWSAPVTVPLVQPGYWVWHIDVEWVPSRKEFWALYNVKSATDCNTPAVYLATSPDGVTWTTYAGPVLARGATPAFADIVYRSSFEYAPVSDVITFWYSGARWDVGGFVWSAAVERRPRESVFAEMARAPSAMRTDGWGRAGVPLLDEETAP
jgi:hypothetical protein